MKANHRPATDRLRSRIGALEARYDAGIGRKKGNPYQFCKGCGKHSPAVSNEGHGKGCFMKGLRHEIRFYRKLLWTLEHEGSTEGFYDAGAQLL